MLVNLCFYADLLDPLKKLSLNFQKENIDTVAASESINKTKHHIDKLRRMSVTEFPHIKYLKQKITENDEDDSFCYQNLKLNGLDEEINKLESKKDTEIDKLMESFSGRIEQNDSEYFEAVSQVLNCEGLFYYSNTFY